MKRDALQAHKARIADVERSIQKSRSDVRRLERTLDRDPDNQEVKTRLEGMYKESQALNAESAALMGDPSFANSSIHPPTIRTAIALTLPTMMGNDSMAFSDLASSSPTIWMAIGSGRNSSNIPITAGEGPLCRKS